MLGRTYLSLLTVITCITLSLCFDMPRFDVEPYAEKCKTVLLSNVKKHWTVGCPNVLAVLSPSQTLEVHIQTTGEISSQEVSLHLACPGSPMVTISLTKETTTEQTFCQLQKMTLRLSHDPRQKGLHRYIFQLRDSNLEVSQAFQQYVHMTVSIRLESLGHDLTLTSNSLHIYSLDPLLSWKQSEATATNKFMTSEALDFFAKTPFTSTEDFPQIQFINNGFLNALTTVKNTFFEHMLELGGVIDLASSACNIEVTKHMLFLNRLANINYGAMGQIYYYFDIVTGKLYFSKKGIATIFSTYASEIGDRKSSICAYVGLGNVDIYKAQVSTSKVYSVSDYQKDTSASADKCYKIPGVGASTKVTMYSGFSRFVVKCPIICNYDTNVEFYHDNKAIISDGRITSPKVLHNSLIFPEVTEVTHDGPYECRKDSFKHNFDISIVSFPRFTVGSNDNSLPSDLYAMEGESLAFSCKVQYAGFSVELKPEFYYISFSKSWQGPLNTDNFNTYLGKTAVKTTLSTEKTKGLSSLQVDIVSVPPIDSSTKRNFTHRFVCNATVSKPELTPLNMNSYSETTGSNVIFVPIPTFANILAYPRNNCSIQGCKPKDGAMFWFKFSPEYAQYIKHAGIVVTGYFMLDDMNVHNIPVLSRTKTVFNSNDDFSLAFEVPPLTVDDKPLHDELIKRKSLRAVFNFLYNGTVPKGIAIDKSRYGKSRVADNMDCRGEEQSTCFYSTLFPSYLKDGRLDFLAIPIDFRINDPLPPSTANTGMIVGILIAVIIILAVVALVAFICMRDKGETYLVDDKERKQGNNPELELREELFKEYQRPAESGKPPKEVPEDQAKEFERQSYKSETSLDDQELDEY